MLFLAPGGSSLFPDFATDRLGGRRDAALLAGAFVWGSSGSVDRQKLSSMGVPKAHRHPRLSADHSTGPPDHNPFAHARLHQKTASRATCLERFGAPGDTPGQHCEDNPLLTIAARDRVFIASYDIAALVGFAACRFYNFCLICSPFVCVIL